ncbi:MAG: DUF421 domain-containing protein [Deltaproteobacteria bacterium]|nr:DUF421 domain-containing protein [Deltaproteobacteria bacterium]
MDWFTTTLDGVGGALATAVGIYLAVLLLTRLFGLRSFSKLSGFDFPLTIAMGTVLASTALAPDPPLGRAVAVLAAFYVLKVGLGAARFRSRRVEDAVDNTPRLLMAGSRILDEQLRRSHMTRSELRAKLREANVLDWSQVRAVVLETTGDVSVLHGESGGPPLDPSLLEGVEGIEALESP